MKFSFYVKFALFNDGWKHWEKLIKLWNEKRHLIAAVS